MTALHFNGLEEAAAYVADMEQVAFYDRRDTEARHSRRFDPVSEMYPRIVIETYDGDYDRAAEESDEQVAAAVAAWGEANGLGEVDWRAVGAIERHLGWTHWL